MTNIAQQIQKATENWDIDAMLKALIDDEPELITEQEELRLALNQVKNGDLSQARITQVSLSPITETRHKTRLSQLKFAEKLGISVTTLRSWERGMRKPSGAAQTLLNLLNRKPELINELQSPTP